MGKEYYEELEAKIVAILQEAQQNPKTENTGLTVPEICDKANTSDEEAVSHILGELETVTEIIAQTGHKTAYRPNGEAVYIGQFDLVK